MPGGAGGSAGPYGSSGGGGGGGGATVIKLNGQYWIVAGGGAGGGGGGQYGTGKDTVGFRASNTLYGGNGDSHAGDGGGGGGGGGGYVSGGLGGSVYEDDGTALGDVGGYSGSWGDSLYPYGFYDNADGTNAPSSRGFVTVNYSSNTGAPYFSGGIISYGPTQNGQTPITHTFNSDGKLIGLGSTNKTSVAWQQLLNPYYKQGDDWKPIRAVHTKRNGEWKKVWPSNGKVEYTIPGAHEFTVPPGIYSLTIVAAGGGGGGGGGVSSTAGGGGGAGEYTTQTVSVTPGQKLAVFVGAGGDGGQGLDEQYGSASTGANGRGTTVTGTGVSISVAGGTGGTGGVATAPPSGGGGGCCVISTALADRGVWSQRDKFDLIAWCEKYLHGTWWGETFRRGYQVLGSKVVIPTLLKKDGSLLANYANWAFTNGCNLVRGKKFSLWSLPSSVLWIAAFMAVGTVVSTKYATKCWKALYKDRE
jgi:hypothetical protein